MLFPILDQKPYGFWEGMLNRATRDSRRVWFCCLQLPTAAYYLLIQATMDNVVTNDSSTDTVSFAYVVIIDKYWPYARSFIESINSFMKISCIATLMILRHQSVLQHMT